MILLTNGSLAPQQQELLNVIYKPTVQVKKVELTIDQKIKSNFYKCNTEIQWIRADNAQCLNKPVVVRTPKTTTQAQKPVRRAENASGSTGNGYEPGQCTFWAKSKRPDIPNNWGNASAWLGNAQAQGWPTGSTPVAGAVGWTSGHVVYIESVGEDGTVTYSDMNGRFVAWEIGGGVRPASYYQYIY
jgi:surface antigen